ncbi:MAG: hypothetical protein ACOCPX_03260 [Halapricum sp.]
MIEVLTDSSLLGTCGIEVPTVIGPFEMAGVADPPLRVSEGVDRLSDLLE